MNNIKKAGILSTLFMGLGQFYNKEWFKGIIYALIEVIFIVNALNGSLYMTFWGLITLGETKGVKGDHSINLLINSLMAIIVLGLFVLVYFINIKDAKEARKRIEAGEKAESIKGTLVRLNTTYFPHVMMAPGALLILFFTFLPILFTTLIAFTNFAAPYHLPPGNLVDWVGFENFVKLVTLPGWKETFFGVFGWTLVWTVATTVLNYFGGLGLALLTNSKDIKFKKLWRTLFIVPYAIPAFISLLTFRLILSGPGPLNSTLLQFGWISEKIPFLTDPTLAKIVVIVVYMWAGSPYWMALMSGILTNIDASLYEASDIDGASKWQQFTKITVPMVLFQTAPLLIMTFAHNFNNFGMIYLLNSGNPANPVYKQAGSTDILISWIYKMTLEKQWYGMAAAVTIVIFLIVATFAVIGFTQTKSFKEEDMI
ncbi:MULTISPECIES: sugar ABC transporter permease [unclassified Fusibacter]|uniref:sugar ABC transporter permease n=1 Tax=unclassified Fusibacter TaxID=2624464 RepID=UPI001013394E|nr:MULTISPECIES: sugar ABC transporter permease [unclassified Fusibacter]MCK8059047.1 ABC transporter permease subunit [Fusibacter sp. A2]NPE22458.1 sugar ABC transporter permease [Fusibacter sp. A1]RXV60562.1 sugar ABC transporter permease [Fusibacter sp. A1]